MANLREEVSNANHLRTLAAPEDLNRLRSDFAILSRRVEQHDLGGMRGDLIMITQKVEDLRGEVKMLGESCVLCADGKARAPEKRQERAQHVDEWVPQLVLERGEVDRRLQQLEKRVPKPLRDVEEPFEDVVSQLVMGVLKMAQLLGVAAEDAYDKLGWRNACNDLPRMMDHAWLRSRLPKRASILKILRQKADADTVRELQGQVELLTHAASTGGSCVHGQEARTAARTAGLALRDRPSSPPVESIAFSRDSSPSNRLCERPPTAPNLRATSVARAERVAWLGSFNSA